MNRRLFGMSENEIAKHICHGADLTGLEGQRWGIAANGLRLWFDVAAEIVDELAAFGYTDCKPAEPEGQNELCRVEGAEVIVVVEMEVGDDFLAYDTVVFCANQMAIPAITHAIDPLIKKFGRKHHDLRHFSLNANA